METRDEAVDDASAPAIGASGSAAGSTSSAAAAAASSDSAADASASIEFKSLNLPLGYHFVPTDAELVVNFLRPRLKNKPPPLPIFIDERVLDYHPEQLIDKYRMYGEDRWFFFTRKERKHAGGKRPNRTTPGNGHWNATGSLRPIYYGGALVGCAGTLVFYEASRKKKKEDAAAAPAGGAEPASPDEDNKGKTDWTMYEYESLTSEAEFEARRNGEGKIDELVLCTIQKKKHCEEKGKKKRKRTEDQEGTPRSDGSGEKKGRGVGRKRKDQVSSLDSGSSDKKSSRANNGSNKKGSRTKGRNRKELAQEQEAYVRRLLMEKPQQELLIQAPLGLGEETVNTDPNMNMSHGSVTTSTMLPSSSQEMMPPVPAAAGTQSNSVHPNYVMHQNLFQPMEILLLQTPTLREHFPYEQTYYYPQHMEIDTMAPPEVYNSGLGPEYSYYEYANANHHPLGIDMDYHDLQSCQFPAQPSYGIGGSTSTQGTFPRPPGNNSVNSKPKY